MTAILEPRTTAPTGTTSADQPVLDLVTTAPAPAPERTPSPRPVDRTPRERRVLSRTGLRLVGAALLGLLVLGIAVQPVADGPEPIAPFWVHAVDTVISVAMLAAVAGFVLARRWALWAGLTTGGGLLLMSSLCPTTGHTTSWPPGGACRWRSAWR